jgi:hypothetical protein
MGERSDEITRTGLRHEVLGERVVREKRLKGRMVMESALGVDSKRYEFQSANNESRRR